MPTIRPTPPPARPPARPALFPRERWARIALVLIVLFALCRSLAWASSQPSWLAPDEDYHWLYTEWVLNQKSVPELDKPAWTSELYGAVLVVNRKVDYFSRARTDYTGDPKAAVKEVGDFPGDTREQAPPTLRQVLHPPLYYTGTVLIDRSIVERSAITRLTVMRYWSALLGALATLFAFVLASQVFSRRWEQLAATTIYAAQPGLAFTFGILGNDAAVAAAFTAALAYCAFLLKTTADPRQGWWLGGILAAAALSKSTALSLVGLAGLVLWWMWRTRAEQRAAVKAIAKRAALVLAVVIGPWYAHVLRETGSVLGDNDTLAPSQPGAEHKALTHIPVAVYDWLAATYPAYWFNYLGYEVKERGVWYYLPIVLGTIAIAGLIAWAVAQAVPALGAWRAARRAGERRGVRSWLNGPGTGSDSATGSQAAMLVVAHLALLVPFLTLEVVRALKSIPFLGPAGRFITPAYAGAAVLCLIGIRMLTREHRIAYPLAVFAWVLAAVILYFRTYLHWGIERFYGPIEGIDVVEAFRHASFDKPEWVTSTFFGVMVFGGAALLLAALALVMTQGRRPSVIAGRRRARAPVGGAPE